MFLIRAALGFVLIQAFLALPLMAQDVTLTSRDGSVEISGALVGYDGEFYRVDTVYGTLTVDGSGVLCAGPGCPDLASYVAKIRFSGASSIGATLMPVLISSFARQQNYQIKRIVTDDRHFTFTLNDAGNDRKVAEFIFQVSNSDEGFADLFAEEADIALSVREVTQEEISRGQEAGLGNLGALNQARVIALDALVPIVSDQNPVRAISPSDLFRAYSGEVGNWQELGGVDAPIELHLNAANSGLAKVFMAHMGNASSVLNQSVNRHSFALDLVDKVAGDPFALGIAALSDTGNARRLTLSGKCGFQSVAESESLRTEDYPLTVPLLLYLPARRLPTIAREFLRFLGSSTAQSAVRKAGFVDQSLFEIPLSRQGDRFANAIISAGAEVSLKELQRMVSALDGARRLSLSFRFENGSSDLDAQSRSNIVLIARALESGEFDESEILFVGFSDGEGQASSNTRLSGKRAASVKAAVLREATTVDPSRVTLKVEAFGEAMPMACDDTIWGRQVNRRVEVWVR